MPINFGNTFFNFYPEHQITLNNTETYKAYKNNSSMWNMDMAKKCTCTVKLNGITHEKMISKMRHKTYGDFLPIKSISYTPFEVGFETIDTGIYGSLPLLSSMSSGNINLTIYDTDHDVYEAALYAWYNSCKPSGGYVPYMSDIIKTLEYKGFTNKGVLNSQAKFNVIPRGSYSVDKDYESNDLKTISIELTVVGEPVTFNIKSIEDEG